MNLPSSPGQAIALVVAAGSGRRMGFDKIVAPLAGQPVVCWSLDAFENCPDISEGILVCAPGRGEEFRRLAVSFPKFRRVVGGGAERTDSVLNGLSAMEGDPEAIVAVHDGARPLITPAVISAVVAAARAGGAAVAAEPAADTLHRAGDAGCLVETVSRDNLWAMQTPQAAGRHLLQHALEAARKSGQHVTDEISALLATGVRATPVPHGTLNFKVTWPRDLELAESVLRRRLDRQ